jgi:hypothetical protein
MALEGDVAVLHQHDPVADLQGLRVTIITIAMSPRRPEPLDEPDNQPGLAPARRRERLVEQKDARFRIDRALDRGHVDADFSPITISKVKALMPCKVKPSWNTPSMMPPMIVPAPPAITGAVGTG